MKRIFVLAVLALVGVYVSGRISLGESGAVRFLMKMENLMGEAKFDEVCDLFHEDLQFHLTDHTGGEAKEVTGGKAEFCALARTQAAALALVPHTMNTQVENVKATLDWKHPWTSQVTYTENRSLTIQGANVTLNTTSDDNITLVRTLSGVKLRRVEAEAWVAE